MRGKTLYDLRCDELTSALRFSLYQHTFDSYCYGLYGSLTNGVPKMANPDYFYIVADAAGNKQGSYSHYDEAGAQVLADNLAQAVPGKAYYVMKPVTKSVTAKPVTTTRL